MATAQVGCTTKPPDARRNGRTQELRVSSSRARGARRWRFWIKKSVRSEADDGILEGDCSRTAIG